MQLVAFELHDNLQVVRDYKYTYSKDKWVARRLLGGFSLAGFPSDTIETYSRYIVGVGKPHRLSSDALEMLKTTGIASPYRRQADPRHRPAAQQ